jgi:hypothetical protein
LSSSGPWLLEAEERRQRFEESIPYHTEVIEWFRQIERRCQLLELSR